MLAVSLQPVRRQIYYGFHCDNSTNEDLQAADVDSHN